MHDLNIQSTTIEKGLELVKSFLDKAFGGAIEELGSVLSDKIRMRRAFNQLRVFEKAKKIAEEQNIDIKKINFKSMFPLLEGIAVEEDENLQNMWTNLLLNSIDSSKNLRVNVFPNILKQLSTNEVKTLMKFDANEGFSITVIESMIGSKKIWEKVPLYELDNLVRLSLVVRIQDPSYDSSKDSMLSIDQYINKSYPPLAYRITNLGHEFLIACSGPAIDAPLFKTQGE